MCKGMHFRPFNKTKYQISFNFFLLFPHLFVPLQRNYQHIMATDKIRIKDIAERAGVSVGTVDRVLHERPNVSKAAREKVEQALAEMDYQPNVYASALAYNKDYTFYCIIPMHDSEAYWDEIKQGVKAATARRRDFHVSLKILYYERFNAPSFIKVAKECLDQTCQTGDNPKLYRPVERTQHSIHPARLLPARPEATGVLWSGLFPERLFRSPHDDAHCLERERNHDDETTQGRTRWLQAAVKS